jgi:tRNA G18 (ribose-2'-O)-methylase SpoU
MNPTGKQLHHQQVIAKQNIKKFPLSLILHDIDSPDNVGGIFRLADTAGIQHIYLSGCTPAPPNKRLSRAARSTEKWVEYSYQADILQLITSLQLRRTTLLALEITEHSQALDDYCRELAEAPAQPAQEFCLILGSEENGVCEFLLERCSTALHIPMFGRNSSMNIVAASSIACYQLCQHLHRPAAD